MTRLDSLVRSLRASSRAVLAIEFVLACVAVFYVWAEYQVFSSGDVRFGPTEPAGFALSMLLSCTGIVATLLRRRWPLVMAVLGPATLIAIRELDVPDLTVSSVVLVLTLYAAGRYGRDDRRNVVRAIVAIAMIVVVVRDAWISFDQLDTLGVTVRTYLFSISQGILVNVLLLAITWWAGDAARKRHEREQELAARSIELEMSRAENSRRAVMDERVRIARELHDIVAHHVSVMGLQAGAARRIVDHDPAAATEPLLAIEESSREAVAELHRLLGFLRRADEVDPDGVGPDALDPTPGLERLPELCRQLEAAGLRVDLTATGTVRDLPPSADLSAFRIIQEGVTNSLKYANVDSVEVDLDYGADSLTVVVRDRGRGAAAATTDAGSGQGLRGMAERVALLGGSLRHGPRTGGGFEITAELPWHGRVDPAPAARPADTTEPQSVTANKDLA